MDEHLLGEGGKIEALYDWFAVEEQPLCLARWHLDRSVVAEIGAAGHAVVAGTAELSHPLILDRATKESEAA
jgi:hypothetical protein